MLWSESILHRRSQAESRRGLSSGWVSDSCYLAHVCAVLPTCVCKVEFVVLSVVSKLEFDVLGLTGDLCFVLGGSRLQVRTSFGRRCLFQRRPRSEYFDSWRWWTWNEALHMSLAVGGLLLGYGIGATLGAAVSVVSAELSGTDWYALSSLQTGLVVSGSLYGALLVLMVSCFDLLG